ncbi:Ppx/GppA family phosphatase [Nocardioides cavernae]|uniref:Ppx/GppA family phosphatase n=1 Tax=Nocardioides cavernae TaxID=1921566 RepID=A0ABR8NGF3_9ACTN|nr:Ppx/GppA family phosphatase [Nocardioides cavernae]MBD3927213.1 Ppx/GppA family phosphatase [Nocardioides cavernae]MBM7512935.1 exopolyphosphatase/guanosine-5'-triphosphate,3'-diphosphate pyrophosphatase [Nocardioides cavernae]
MTDHPVHPSAPAVVPRWEWRTFGNDLDALDALAPLRTAAPVESDETYVLSMYGDASVKVRDGVLDVKVLQQVSGAGLQLWVPTMKAPFPLDTGAVAAAFAALGAPPPETRRTELGLDQLVEDLVAPRDDLRVVAIHKGRRRSIVDDCMVELTAVSAEGRTVTTVAVESPDPDLVSRTIGRLGLDGRPNVCVARGLKSVLGWGPRRFAVLDVGTNSVKFARGRRDEGGTPRIEEETAVVTRLGEGLVAAGGLTPASMSRTVDAIGDLVDDARRDGPLDIVAVGTAGIRQAPNRDELLAAVLSRCGVTVEVISGRDEARLAYMAAVSTLPLSGDRLLVFDSGGGSSQFTSGSVDRIEEQFSVDVGAVRFAERFGLAAAVPRETVDAALDAIAAELAELGDRPRPDMVIAIGGTSTNLAAIKHGLDRYDPDTVHGTVLDATDVDGQIEAFRTRSTEQRRGIAGLQPARAEVILAGACIVRTILTLTRQDALTVSDRGLRHGVIAERFGSPQPP